VHGITPKDGRPFDWGRSSGDYSEFRPGPPPSFYARLRDLGVGVPGQRILDLGTGTGVLARTFAAAGARVVGIDVSEEQLAAARRLAAEQGVDVEFRLAPAEDTGLAAASFDAITANQCWLYFDRDRAVAEVLRLLADGGVLVTSHLSWLPRLDEVARRSEELVLSFNPGWRAADWDGVVPEVPRLAGRDLVVAGRFVYDEPIPFTRASWRGRIRACRGVGPTLSDDELARFDAAHAELLAAIAPEEFTILHRIDAHVMRPAQTPG
jgi:SAM-dependent methyltransferase